MLGFLKKKIQEGIAKLTGGIKKEVDDKESHIEDKKTEEKKEIKKEHNIKEKTTEINEDNTHEEKEKLSFGDLFTKKTLSEDKFDELFWDIEIGLLESNVAMEVIEKIKQDLKKVLVDKKINRFKIEETIKDTLLNSLKEILEIKHEDLIKEIKSKKEKPYTIIFIGINGGGKTTSIAKLTNYFQKHKLSCTIAACDTFRAAAIHQIEEHANKLNVKLIKHDYGADAAAVAFDAKAYAKAKNVDVLLIDTAGRNHANDNLMDELEKLIKVTAPDKILFIGDALTGNDAVEQAREFHQKVGIDGIILSKFDCDEKGGCAISMSYITKKPILYIGTGQNYDDIMPFDSKVILEKLSIEKSENVEKSHILEEIKEKATKEESEEIVADEELREAEIQEEQLQEVAIAKKEIEEITETDDEKTKENIKENIKQEEINAINKEFNEETIEDEIKEEEIKEEQEEPIKEIKKIEQEQESEEEKEIELEEEELKVEEQEEEITKIKEIKRKEKHKEQIIKEEEEKTKVPEKKKEHKEPKKEEHKKEKIIEVKKPEHKKNVQKEEKKHEYKKEEIKKVTKEKEHRELKTEKKTKEHLKSKKETPKKVHKDIEKREVKKEHKKHESEQKEEKSEEKKKMGFWGKLFGKK